MTTKRYAAHYRGRFIGLFKTPEDRDNAREYFRMQSLIDKPKKTSPTFLKDLAQEIKSLEASLKIKEDRATRIKLQALLLEYFRD